MTTALAKLEQQLQDVDNLIARHPNRQPDAGDTDAGIIRRPAGDQKPLLRSCILLTYAAWEVYAEDSVLAAVQAVVEGGTLEQMPASLRDFVAAQLKNDPWLLAGEGWKRAVVKEVTLRVRGDDTDEDGKFGINTAGPGQIGALHDQVLGERLLDECRWGGMSDERARSELARLVRLRGSIAHTGRDQGGLGLNEVESWRTFVWSLGQKLDSLLDDWVARQLA